MKFNIYTGSDGNLMPFKIFKVLFLDTKISNINRSIFMKVVLYAYTNLCIQQVGICNITIINKGIEF